MERRLSPRLYDNNLPLDIPRYILMQPSLFYFGLHYGSLCIPRKSSIARWLSTKLHNTCNSVANSLQRSYSLEIKENQGANNIPANVRPDGRGWMWQYLIRASRVDSAIQNDALEIHRRINRAPELEGMLEGSSILLQPNRDFL